MLLEFTAAELAGALLDWVTGPLFEPSESTETGTLALMGTIWVEVAVGAGLLISLVGLTPDLGCRGLRTVVPLALVALADPLALVALARSSPGPGCPGPGCPHPVACPDCPKT